MGASNPDHQSEALQKLLFKFVDQLRASARKDADSKNGCLEVVDQEIKDLTDIAEHLHKDELEHHAGNHDHRKYVIKIRNDVIEYRF